MFYCVGTTLATTTFTSSIAFVHPLLLQCCMEYYISLANTGILQYEHTCTETWYHSAYTWQAKRQVNF